MTWYPGEEGTVWKLGTNTRWEIRGGTEECDPCLAEVHDFLKEGRLGGRIYRQEQVSMVPVACLGVQPHHAVLDMCASPGSKTNQAVEALHAGGEACPAGIVVACEPNRQRCSNLVGEVYLYL